MLFVIITLAALLGSSCAELKLRNSQCKFPFVYEDHTYHYCTKLKGDNVPWCAMDHEYQRGRFVNCVPHVCAFPFKYKGKTYDTCTKDDSSSYWCSGTTDYNGTYYPCAGFDGVYDVTFSCKSSNAQTYKVGESWTQDCVKYTCQEEGRYHYEPKCPGVDGCYEVGSQNFKCKIEGREYQNCSCRGTKERPMLYYTYSSDSDNQNNNRSSETNYKRVCLRNGKEVTEWEDNCHQFTCPNGNPTLVKRGCMDETKKCFDLNSKDFPCRVGDKTWSKCSCSLSKDDRPMLSARD